MNVAKQQHRSLNRSLNNPAAITIAACELARMLVTKADELDAAFLKHADPRAVQGGAICEEANEWRELSRQAHQLYRQISELED